MIRIVRKTKTGFTASCIAVILPCFFLFPLQLSAQKKVGATPVDRKEAINLSKVFKQYALFNINTTGLSGFAKSSGSDPINFVLDLPNYGQLPITLKEKDILTGNYQLVVGNAQGRQKSGRPGYKTYAGQLSNDTASSVYLTISDRTIYGFIKGQGKEYFIEPLRYFDKKANPNIFVFYEAHDVVPQSGITCGLTEVAQRNFTASVSVHMQTLAGTATGTCKMVELAIASDASMVAKYSSAADVEEHNISVINMMVGLYGNAQIGTQYLEFKISGQYISTNAATDPFTPAYSGPDAAILLSNFTSWGNAGNFGFSYDLGEVWTARDIGTETSPGSGIYNYGVIGLAWVGTLCLFYRYQLLEDALSSSLGQAVTAAHETGHNLNAQHDATSGYIMYSSINATSPATTFSSASLSAMNTYLGDPSVTCLNSCSVNQPVAQFNMSSKTICTGNSITFSNYSVGEVSSISWNFPGGSPASSTTANPTVSYSTPGSKTATLTVTNASGTSSVSKDIFVGNPPTTGCQQFITGNSEYATILSFSLKGIQHNNGSYLIGGNYQDLACTDNTLLEPGTTYTVSTTAGYLGGPFDIKNKLQLFIDYNNDGDFLDANETIYTSPTCIQGKYNFSFTTPATVPVKGTWLRLRFIAMPCSLAPSNGCAIPTNAQAEDYAVYFADVCPALILPTAADQASVAVSGAGTTTITSASCGLIASLLPNGANPVSGPVDGKVWIEPGVPFYAGQPYVARHYQITPATNSSTATGTVTLYFTQAEFDAYNVAPDNYANLPAGPSDAAGIANLRVEKFPGTSSDGSGLPATYTGTPLMIDPNDASIVWNSTQSRWEVSIDVSSFSGFIVHGSIYALPLRLLSFHAARQDKNVLLDWLTTAESGVSHFEIERSTDGVKYLVVGQVAAQNVPGDQLYRYTDLNAAAMGAGSTIYYRLKMVDISGKFTYSDIRRVALEGTASISIYPNPVHSTLLVQMPVAPAGTLSLRLVDPQGRNIKTWNYSTAAGLLQLDVQAVPEGIYYLEIRQGSSEHRVVKVVKL
ncbi:GEVED domain-containing protein [Flavihumibacter profundi]|uniref:GEVED domain-containing protein n=1 Tax=Flavihumibacter profundi TaxID=2716883 RepID=UPI001CC7913D|nr:GEVED domain-containing protein [Flavihumibacter profundi]MBZ5857698.1 M12 family metallo-peptidase [Flavihumibacter profundi]